MAVPPVVVVAVTAFSAAFAAAPQPSHVYDGCDLWPGVSGELAVPYLERAFEFGWRRGLVPGFEAVGKR